jgi:hypothetical protein
MEGMIKSEWLVTNRWVVLEPREVTEKSTWPSLGDPGSKD